MRLGRIFLQKKVLQIPKVWKKLLKKLFFVWTLDKYDQADNCLVTK